MNGPQHWSRNGNEVNPGAPSANGTEEDEGKIRKNGISR